VVRAVVKEKLRTKLGQIHKYWFREKRFLRANTWLRSANAPLMMPNERRIKLNEAPFI
jgi:hypothetical protein